MLTSMMFPGRYYQGKNCLEQFAARTAHFGKKFLMLGTKTAIKVTKDVLLKSFQGYDAEVRFELSSGNPVDSEYDRLRAIVKAEDPDVVVGIGGGGIIDMARSVAVSCGKILVVIPTVVASDAACTNVCLHYGEDGSVLGPEILHKNPDMVFVDPCMIAAAPAKLMLAGIGDALATYYEARTCYDNGIINPDGLGITYTTMKMTEICRDILFDYAFQAMTACRNKVVTPAFEKVVEACAFLSGVACLNAGCAGAHGFGDLMSRLPGGHDMMHGDRVTVGLIIQLVLEGRDSGEIEGVIAFCKELGMPTTVKELGFEDVSAVAEFLGREGENEFTINNMRHIDHSAAAIYGACITATALCEEM